MGELILFKPRGKGEAPASPDPHNLAHMGDHPLTESELRAALLHMDDDEEDDSAC